MIRKRKASSFFFVIVDRVLDSSRLCYIFPFLPLLSRRMIFLLYDEVSGYSPTTAVSESKVEQGGGPCAVE